MDNVLPKFRQCAKHLQDFTHFLHFPKDLNKNCAKENRTVQKNNVFWLNICVVHRIISAKAQHSVAFSKVASQDYVGKTF